MFNIILPKPCEIFAKSLTKKFKSTTDPMVHSTNTILAHSGRMIYFRETSNASPGFIYYNINPFVEILDFYLLDFLV